MKINIDLELTENDVEKIIKIADLFEKEEQETFLRKKHEKPTEKKEPKAQICQRTVNRRGININGKDYFDNELTELFGSLVTIVSTSNEIIVFNNKNEMVSRFPIENTSLKYDATMDEIKRAFNNIRD